MNDNVDYRAPAELFPAPSHRGPVGYRRFDSLAEAVKYAVEELNKSQLLGVFLEADEVRYGRSEIVSLYEAPGFPLPRGVAQD